ncbi:MAG: VOC family protein [Gammaproteobacteria bacterium]|jgi:predicted enzyme related to lactoylglutathione lyase|nr:VOC family protein [Gammaproteobacteria bacterium]
MKNIKNTISVILLSFAYLTLSMQLSAEELPSTNSSVTFIYYKDMAAGENFYGNILGFKKDFDGEWVKIFRIADGGRVGLVDETKGYLKGAKDKPVMISIDTSDVQGWYERVKVSGAKYLETHLKDHSDGFANSFMMKDPEGYTVEFFQWNDQHKPY